MQKKTVIITGAGASVPYDMPTTDDLRKYIIANHYELAIYLAGGDQFASQRQDLQRHARQFVEAFDKSNCESIDQFLKCQPQYSDLGRAAIANAIIRAHHRRDKLLAPKFDWFQYLLNRMADRCDTAEKFKANSISFITFNYDRLIEQGINNVCYYRYGENIDVDAFDRSELPFKVVHVYGKICLKSQRDQLLMINLIQNSVHQIRIIDRGQDTGIVERLQDLLSNAEHDIVASMSRKGNCYDNAAMESFWGTLKTELDEPLPTRAVAHAALFSYIEVFYNRQRLHSTLGYLSPAAYEQKHQAA